MIRSAIFIALFPTVGFAQQIWVDQNYVEWCFSQAQNTNGLSSCLGKAANACQTAPGNETTLGIAQCIQAETAVWDSFLNEQYQLRRAELADQNPELVNQLRDVQRTWIAFRDAECGLQYSLWLGGSIRTIVAANCILTETAERALELRDLGSME